MFIGTPVHPPGADNSVPASRHANVIAPAGLAGSELIYFAGAGAGAGAAGGVTITVLPLPDLPVSPWLP